MITNTSILILNDGSERNIPVITDSTGKTEYAGRDFNFHYGYKTKIKQSCSVTFRGEFYVFGGEFEQKKQIAKVTDCSLKKIGNLRFDFTYGTCAVVNEESIYLCFSNNKVDSQKQCYVGADPVGSFSKINQSQFYHDYTRIATNEGNHFDLDVFNILFLDFLLAVGASDYHEHKRKVEKYEFDTMSWVSFGEYPFDMVQTTFYLTKEV